MIIIYLIFILTILFLFILFSLLLFLAVRKAFYNVKEIHRQYYYQKIYPQLSRYITTGGASYHRMFHPKSPWKRAVVFDILLRLAESLKSENEVKRIKEVIYTLDVSNKLAEQMKDPRWWISTNATRQAGRLKLDKLHSIMIENLYSPHYDLWAASARALCHINRTEDLITFLMEKEEELKPPSVIRIGDMLVQSKRVASDMMIEHIDQVSPLLQGIFLETLGKKKVIEALPIVESYLDSNDQELRYKVLKTIGDIGITTREEEMIQLLQSEDWRERLLTIQVIQGCRIKRAIPTLMELLSDPQWWVRLRAAEALYSFGEDGIQKLQWASYAHQDHFAKDMAEKILQDKKFEVSLY